MPSEWGVMSGNGKELYRCVPAQGQDQGEGAGKVFLCEFLRALVPHDKFLRFLDRRKERAYGLVCWPLLEGEEVCYCLWVTQVARKPVASLRCMSHHSPLLQDRERGLHGVVMEREDVHIILWVRPRLQ